VPAGSGLTGLWRPIPGVGATSGALAFLVGDGTLVFSLRQDGNALKGSVEGTGSGFFGGNDAPVSITEGKVDGNNVSFKAGNNTYSGMLKEDQIELQRTVELGFRLPNISEETAGSRPAIGPPLDGSDPSIGAFRRLPSSIPVVLRRVQR
jgi:beta-galactosidase